MSVTQATLLGDTFGSKASGTIPIGGIIMWSGSVASVPTGWSICNGANGTPNLQDKFIVGAGSGYAVAATGGSADATLVSHSHTATSTVTDPGHNHGYTASNNQNVVRGSFGASAPNCNVGVFGAVTSGSGTGISVSTSIAASGSPATNANLPPYYALAFIMRVS